MTSYQEHTLAGSSPVELVIALYDGIIRFLYSAIGAVEQGDVVGRRMAVKRALAILIHLQARLRMDIGGEPAKVLSEFYASMFAVILQASQGASVEKFQEAIDCVRTLRDAWRQVAMDPALNATVSPAAAQSQRPPVAFDSERGSHWTA